MDKLLDIGACTCPDLQDGAMPTNKVHLEVVDEFIPAQKSPPVKDPERSELKQLDLFLFLEQLPILLRKFLRTVYIAKIVLDFIPFGSFKLHTDKRLGSFHKIRYAHILVTLVDKQFQYFSDPP